MLMDEEAANPTAGSSRSSKKDPSVPVEVLSIEILVVAVATVIDPDTLLKDVPWPNFFRALVFTGEVRILPA